MPVSRGTGGEAQAALLLCQVGTRVCALPLSHVVETLRPLPVEPLPAQQPFVTGLSLVRGRATPIVDARRLLGCTIEDRRHERLVLLQFDDRRVALAVDAVIGVHHLPQRDLRELPELLRQAEHEVIKTLGTLDAGLLLVLDQSKLVPESVWSELQTEAARP